MTIHMTLDCADFASDKGLWNDDNCGLRKPYICEKCPSCGPVVVPPTEPPTGGCPDGKLKLSTA